MRHTKSIARKHTQLRREHARFMHEITARQQAKGAIISYSFDFKPSNDESAWLASAEDFETKSGLKGIYIFVGAQLAAASALTVYGLQSGDSYSLATGAANTVRNAAWLGGHMAVPYIPMIATAPHFAVGKSLHCIARTIEHNTKPGKLEAVYSAKLEVQRNDFFKTMSAISPSKIAPLPFKALKPFATLTQHYMTKAANVITGTAHLPAAQRYERDLMDRTVTQWKDFTDTCKAVHLENILHLPFKAAKPVALCTAYVAAKTTQGTAKLVSRTPGGQKLVNSFTEAAHARAHAILKPAKKRRKELTETLASQMHRDRIHAGINASGALLGTAVHMPQAIGSEDIMIQIGGSIAALGYLKMGVDQIIESSRWNSLYKMAKNKNVKYDHVTAYELVDYSSNGEYLKDTLFKWMPSLELTAKGGLYLFESVHLLNPALAVSGALFAGSAGNEFWEQNGDKIKHFAKHAQAHLHLKRLENLNDDDLKILAEHYSMTREEKTDFITAAARFNIQKPSAIEKDENEPTNAPSSCPEALPA